MDASHYAGIYRRALLEDVLPFWVRHSADRQCGGYFSCLARDGSAFDTDKFTWLQGRQVWTFAKMHRRVEPRDEWLDLSRSGAEFLRDHAFGADGRVFFALERDGTPYARPCFFSDCFAALGLAEYGAAGGAGWAAELAVDTFRGIQRQLADGGTADPRFLPAVRPTESMAPHMINVNLAMEMADALEGEAELFRRCGQASLQKIASLFIDRNEGLVFEHAAPDGGHPDTFAGRLVIPGHALECLWFLVEAADAWDAPHVIPAAAAAILDMLEFGWDAECGGLYYFLDARGKPPEQLEWSQKLWWVHGEALVALLTAYRRTGQTQFAEWFERVHAYTWRHFPDPDYGEWYGYLDREGRPVLPLKGGKWKGCFHVPRTLLRCSELLGSLPF
jgi:N-acylglucosamine 2-epimerase